MQRKEKQQKEKINLVDKSLISVGIVQVLLLLLTAVAFYYEQSTLGVILFFTFTIGFAAKRWAKLSVKGVSAEIGAERTAFFPGESGTVLFKAKNDKKVGIPWMEFCLPIVEPVVIRPTSNISSLEKDNFGNRKFLVRTGRMKAYEEAVYETTWVAIRRGVRTLRTMEISTGDGFGLCYAMIDPKHNSSRDLVVYPKIVEIDIDMFTKFQWEGSHHPKGVLEDPTVIKLTRPYEDTDSMKGINWRMAARGQGLAVNQYEHIRPDKCHFVFDGQSFDGDIRHEQELEDALSILASITLQLEEWGMNTGYSFPNSLTEASVTIMAEKDNIREVLYTMAAYQLREPKMEGTDRDGNIIYSYEDSVFNDDILTATYNETGRIYFVTYDDISADKSMFLKEINENNVRVLTYAGLALLKK